MYLGETWAIYLLVRPWVRRELWVEGSDSMMYDVPRGATCATYLLVGPWTRREVTTRKMILVKNLRCLLDFKTFGGSRVTTR